MLLVLRIFMKMAGFCYLNFVGRSFDVISILIAFDVSKLL